MASSVVRTAASLASPDVATASIVSVKHGRRTACPHGRCHAAVAAAAVRAPSSSAQQQQQQQAVSHRMCDYVGLKASSSYCSASDARIRAMDLLKKVRRGRSCVRRRAITCMADVEEPRVVTSTTRSSGGGQSIGETSLNQQEVVFFDGGSHYGDLVINLIFGLSIVWLPLSVTAVARSMFLRYRLTNRRVTVISGLTGEDRKDFTYKDITDVVCAPRFIGEWGDIVLTLSDKTKIEMKSVPRFREVVSYCEEMMNEAKQSSKGKGGKKSLASLTAAAGSSAEAPRGF